MVHLELTARNDATSERFLQELRLRKKKKTCKCLHAASEYMELSKLYAHFLGQTLGTQAEKNNALISLLAYNFDCTKQKRQFLIGSRILFSVAFDLNATSHGSLLRRKKDVKRVLCWVREVSRISLTLCRPIL